MFFFFYLLSAVLVSSQNKQVSSRNIYILRFLICSSSLKVPPHYYVNFNRRNITKMIKCNLILSFSFLLTYAFQIRYAINTNPTNMSNTGKILLTGLQVFYLLGYGKHLQWGKFSTGVNSAPNILGPCIIIQFEFKHLFL